MLDDECAAPPTIRIRPSAISVPSIIESPPRLPSSRLLSRLPLASLQITSLPLLARSWQLNRPFQQGVQYHEGAYATRSRPESRTRLASKFAASNSPALLWKVVRLLTVELDMDGYGHDQLISSAALN